jgi:pimeloyl-ACP methyl ester carboxylesterase
VQLSRLSGPVSLIWGEDDHEVPVSLAETARSLIKEASLEVLPGIGHFVPVEAPDALRRAIDESLR